MPKAVVITAGIAGLVLVTVALSRLKPAAPSVERSTIIIDGVKRGPMVREVRGPGSLVPEQVRWISAVTGGRVDRVNVRPGDHVSAGTVLLEMSNPDVQLQAITAQQQLGAAQAQLVSLRTQLESQRLNQAGVVASMRTQLHDAQRTLVASESLTTRNLISANDAAHARDAMQELSERLHIEESRLALMTSTVDSQLALQREQVQQLRAIDQYNQARVASMRVTAGTDGVVQDLTLEPGQWVQSGTTLARVLQPGRLKAVLRIPETQARDVALGQSTTVDTHLGIVHGRVIRFDPNSQNGNVTVDIALDGTLPQGARPDLQVEGTIELERLASVVYVGRPAYAQPNAPLGLFKLVDGGHYAERVPVNLGRASVNLIEVTSGLEVGDSVIVSDMTRWDNVDRVRVK